MENHLNLTNTLWELGTKGNLSIFSNGKSLYFSVEDVHKIAMWIKKGQENDTLIIDKKQFLLQNGYLEISYNETLIIIPSYETKRIRHWLETHHKT